MHSPQLRLMIPTSSLRDSSPRSADIILLLAAVSLLTFHKSVILTPLWFYVFRVKQIPDPPHSHFHHPHCLANWSCMVEAVQQHNDYQQQFEKNKCVSIKK